MAESCSCKNGNCCNFENLKQVCNDPTYTPIGLLDNSYPAEVFPKGWECPKCGLVNSPLLSSCPCSKMSIIVSASSVSGEEEIDTINVSAWVLKRTFSSEPSNDLGGEKESEK